MNTPINSQIFSTYNTSNSCYAVNCGMRENCSSNVYNCTNFFCQRKCTVRYPYLEETKIQYSNHTELIK